MADADRLGDADRTARERYDRQQRAAADKERERARKSAETHTELLRRLQGLIRRALDEFPRTRAAEMTPYPVRRGRLLRRNDVMAAWPVGTVDHNWSSWPTQDMPVFLLSNGDLVWSKPGLEDHHAFRYRLQDVFGDADLERMCRTLEARLSGAHPAAPARA